MAIKTYSVDIDVVLQPVGIPKCRISLGDQCQDLIVDCETSVRLFYQGHSAGRLSVEHYGRVDSDPDTAVIIKEIKFNNLSGTKFVYQGIYYPYYPKHLLGNPESLPHQPYLSWNGVWHLDFTLPIYTWIHKVEGLGWIYD